MPGAPLALEPLTTDELTDCMTETVVTRFAPSPTGFLHIGGGRTALFNWLYARGHGGRMLLRIEDTDRERSTKAAIDAIIDGLTWLGIDLGRRGRPPVRARRPPPRGRRGHAGARAAPIAAMHARTSSRQMREAARARGPPALYDGRWRDRDPGRCAARREAGRSASRRRRPARP